MRTQWGWRCRNELGLTNMAVAERGGDSPLQVFFMFQHKWFKHSFLSNKDNARSLFTASGTQGQSSQQPEKSFAEICFYGFTQQPGRHGASFEGQALRGRR